MKRKVIIEGYGWAFSIEEDFSSKFNEIVQNEGSEKADNYFECGEFCEDTVLYNGDQHFLLEFSNVVARKQACHPAFLDPHNEVKYIVQEAESIPVKFDSNGNISWKQDEVA